MKSYSGNHSFLKELNIISVMRVILEKGLVSRAQLADILGLNRSTITAIVNELLLQQLVREVGVGVSKGGRPPTLLQLHKDAAYTVSVDWSSEHVGVTFCNLGGDSMHHAAIRRKAESPQDQIGQVVRTVSDSLRRLPDKPLGLLGIGIVVPGIVENGVVNSYALGWEAVSLAGPFGESFACPVVVDSDANAGLTAETYFGCAKGERNVCYIRAGKSLSAAFVINGHMYRGNDGFAGRIGHNTIEAGGRRCACGNKGCWEAYVSRHALVQRYAELAGSGAASEEGDAIERIAEAAGRSDPAAVTAIHEMAEYLGLGLANVVNLLNPKQVVISNGLGHFEPLMLPALQAVMSRKALPYLRRNVQVLFSSLGDRAMTLGAAALVLDAVFTPPSINRRDVPPGGTLFL